MLNLKLEVPNTKIAKIFFIYFSSLPPSYGSPFHFQEMGNQAILDYNWFLKNIKSLNKLSRIHISSYYFFFFFYKQRMV